MAQYHVRAVHCDHRADDEEVYASLQRATAPLTEAWQKLKNARRITIKFNQAFEPDRLVYIGGQLQELVGYQVARALLRLLRENTTAEIVCTEISTMIHYGEYGSFDETMTLLPVLREFDVPIINGDKPPHRIAQVPGGGSMFRQYLLPAAAVDTDAFVSVQKMKNHHFMGITLCLKNLFGLPPLEPYGRSRTYFHHLVRLPYVLVDLGQIIQPTLNIIDALVGQSGREWGGQGHITDTLIAGDHVIATDACGAWLMGHEPLGDWPVPPFRRERNALRIAHEAGFGTADLSQIDFKTEVMPPLAPFDSDQTDSPYTVLAWRRSMCEQALYYRDHRAEFAQYAGEYILLQDYEVVWHSKNSDLTDSRRQLAGDKKDSALWFKLVDPAEAEGEHYEVYEQTLRQIQDLGL